MMKKALSFLVILLFPLIYSCDKIDDITSFPIDTQTEYYIFLNISESDPTSINEPVYVMVDDPDILDNLGKIDEWKINKITYQVQYYVGSPDILFNGTLSLGSANISVSNLNLNDMYVNTTVSTLNLTDQQLNDLVNDLRSDGSVEGSLSGDVSGQPVQAQIIMTFDMQVRVKK